MNTTNNQTMNAQQVAWLEKHGISYRERRAYNERVRIFTKGEQSAVELTKIYHGTGETHSETQVYLAEDWDHPAGGVFRRNCETLREALWILARGEWKPNTTGISASYRATM